MQTMIRKSIVIGLGGTGQKAILNVKKRYMEVFGEIPPTTKFLAFDTSDKETAMSLPDGEIVKIEDSEFVKMEVKRTKQLLKVNSEIRDWFPDNIPPKNIGAGAHQIRALGRIALYAHAKQVYEIIKRTIVDVKNYYLAASLSNKYGIYGNNLLVNIITSTAGGTGSGTFIDIAHLVRNFTEETDQVIGYLVLPDIYNNLPATEFVEPNTYAAIKELDSCMSISMGETSSFKFNDKEIIIDSSPFDIVFTINSETQNNTTYSDDKELAEIVGGGVFLLAGVTGKGMRDVWDNFQSIVIGKGKWYGKFPHYLSFGLSEIKYDPNVERRNLSDLVISDIIYKISGGCAEINVKADVNNFIRSAGLEEHEADDVIDAILSNKDMPSIKLPKSSKKDAAVKYIDQIKKSISNFETELQDISNRRFQQLKEDMFARVLSFIRNKVDSIGGLSYAQLMIAEMNGRFEECKIEMEDERKEYQDKNKILMPQIDQAIADAHGATKALIGATRKIENRMRELKTLSDRYILNSMEMIRRDYASKFFALLIQELESQTNTINKLKISMDTISHAIGKRMQRYKANLVKTHHPFTIVLPLGYDLDIKAEEFIRWLNINKKMNIIDLGLLTADDITELMDDFCNSLDIIQESKRLSIEDVIKGKDDDVQHEIISRLDDKADPLWKYNSAFVAGKYSTEMIYFLGTENAENTVLRNERLHNALSHKEHKPTIISTGDSCRIICFKAEAALPAFIINNFEKYYEVYSDPDAPFTYHRFRATDHLQELFPPIGENENRKWWSLAFASPFKLINKKGSYYYVKSKSRGMEVDEYEIKLPQGRLSALKEFISDDGLAKEIQKEIEKIAKNIGDAELSDKLNEYCSMLKNEIKNKPDISEDIKILLEQELKDIKDYINALGSI